MKSPAIDSSFEELDLKGVLESGILLAANESFFWPIGLALTVRVHDDGRVSELHLREWVFEDGHHESIYVEPDDVVTQRREAFENWLNEQLASMPDNEAEMARIKLGIINEGA